MSSDLQRFLYAVRTLEKLAWKYGGAEAWLEALGRWATVRQEDEVWFVGDFLEHIGEELSKRRVERPLCCRQCGKEIRIGNETIAKVLGVTTATVCMDVGQVYERVRANALYCSPACRQKAYRSRVTAKSAQPKRKRNGNGKNCISLRLERKKRERAVTADKLLEAGIDPHIITSLNIDGSDDAGD
jgi:hypothetical protein